MAFSREVGKIFLMFFGSCFLMMLKWLFVSLLRVFFFVSE